MIDTPSGSPGRTHKRQVLKQQRASFSLKEGEEQWGDSDNKRLHHGHNTEDRSDIAGNPLQVVGAALTFKLFP